jgi:hypothetical protein
VMLFCWIIANSRALASGKIFLIMLDTALTTLTNSLSGAEEA